MRDAVMGYQVALSPSARRDLRDIVRYILALQDTPSNDAHFGRSTNQHGKAAWPLARFVALAEAGTHLIFRAELGRYKDSEIVLAGKVVGGLRKGMLCLADRLFPGLALWKKATATGAHMLWRAKVGMKLKAERTLPDGSWLATWKSTTRGQEDARGVTVRVIEYRLKGGNGETFRLITSLLDPEGAPAHELAALYPQRWEIELTIKEGRQVLRTGQITLRSKMPGVGQAGVLGPAPGPLHCAQDDGAGGVGRGH